jgi:hypothetical protein
VAEGFKNLLLGFRKGFEGNAAVGNFVAMGELRIRLGRVFSPMENAFDRFPMAMP